MILIAILFPPLVFFLRGKILSGVLSLMVYIVASIFAITGILLPIGIGMYLALTIWAIVSHVNAKNDKKMKQMERKMMASQESNSNNDESKH